MIIWRIWLMCYFFSLSGVAVAGDFYVPASVSLGAQQFIQQFTHQQRDNNYVPEATNLAAWAKIHQLENMRGLNQTLINVYQAKVVTQQLAGVPLLFVYPKQWQNKTRLIIYLHGGAYTFSSAKSSLATILPVANLNA